MKERLNDMLDQFQEMSARIRQAEEEESGYTPTKSKASPPSTGGLDKDWSAPKRVK